MFFNYWVGFVNESHLFLSVCAGLNLYYYLSWNGYGDIINSSIAILCCAVMLIYPFFLGGFYNYTKNYNKIVLRDDQFLSSYGNAIVGLNFLRQGRLVFVHACAVVFRKLWLAFVVVMMQNYPVFSIF